MSCTAQKIKFTIKDFSSKCDQIRRKLQIWSYLLNKPLMENFIFCAVLVLKLLNSSNCSFTSSNNSLPVLITPCPSILGLLAIIFLNKISNGIPNNMPINLPFYSFALPFMVFLTRFISNPNSSRTLLFSWYLSFPCLRLSVQSSAIQKCYFQ